MISSSSSSAIQNGINLSNPYTNGFDFIIRIVIFLAVITAVVIAVRMLPIILKEKKNRGLLEGYKKITPGMTENQVKYIMGCDCLDSFNKDGTFSFKWQIVNKGKMSFASSNGVLGGINGFRDGSASITPGETIEISIFFNKEGHVTDKRIVNI